MVRPHTKDKFFKDDTKNIRMVTSRERWTGRPRIRWLGGVCSDLKVMNVNK
jgi:hypothetical protein